MQPFRDLNEYTALPRATALRLSPDGRRLVAAVQTRAPDGKKHVTSLWLIDPGGDGAAKAPEGPEAVRSAAPRRLTRSAVGEAAPAFLPDGSLLFVSSRPDPAAAPGGGHGAGPGAGAGDGVGAGDAVPALWLLPSGGGEARQIASRPGPVTAVATARDATLIVFAAAALPGTSGPDEDRKRRQARKDAGVTAILHESAPVRHWDHDLGPDQLRFFAAPAPGTGEERVTEPRDLTPDPGRALDEQAFAVSPDGATVVTGWEVDDGGGELHTELVAIDLATGARRVLAAEPAGDFTDPVISPDGAYAVCLRQKHSTYDDPDDVTLALVPLHEDGPPRDLLTALDRRPVTAAWAADSRAVYFTADDEGRCPVFRADTATGEIIRLTADHGAYSELCPAPDGRHVYALRSAVDAPPAPVRLDAARKDQQPTHLPSPGSPLELPGHVVEIDAAADDGARIRGWLALPAGASAQAQAPLLLWVHGGPRTSWNAWSWRWNPWIMVAHGYAVLLPDPALSTGYGQSFVARGHGGWGQRPFGDLIAITDAAVARPDIDAERTAMMGGSYGGYMANWIAGHTRRFRAIVTHAGPWTLDGMTGTTDLPTQWRREFGEPLETPQRYELNSPHLHVADVHTPMLVIHGDKDYRVPAAQALRLWWDLIRHQVDAKFLYFPDENHWILKPAHTVIWYQTVLAFLAHHVLGDPWRRPELL